MCDTAPEGCYLTLKTCKGDGKVTFTKPFLMLGKVTFDKHVNVLGRYCKGEYIIQGPLMGGPQCRLSILRNGYVP